jgi:hypothetical protein
VQSRLLLNVVISKCMPVFELLVGWNTLLVLNLCFHLLMVSEDSTSSVMVLQVRVFTKSAYRHGDEDEMKGQLLLNVVVGQCASILELFPGENKTLLARASGPRSTCQRR